jgi:hypothetical protein
MPYIDSETKREHRSKGKKHPAQVPGALYPCCVGELTAVKAKNAPESNRRGMRENRGPRVMAPTLPFSTEGSNKPPMICLFLEAGAEKARPCTVHSEGMRAFSPGLREERAPPRVERQTVTTPQGSKKSASEHSLEDFWSKESHRVCSSSDRMRSLCAGIPCRDAD